MAPWTAPVDATVDCASFASGLGSRDITEREHDVLALLAQGMDDAGIAERLRISHRTVRSQVSSLFTKLNVCKPHPGRHRWLPHPFGRMCGLPEAGYLVTSQPVKIILED